MFGKRACNCVKTDWNCMFSACAFSCGSVTKESLCKSVVCQSVLLIVLSYKPCHTYIRRLFWSDGCILLTSLSEWDKIFRESEVNEMYLTDQEQWCLAFRDGEIMTRKHWLTTDNPFLFLQANERPGLTYFNQWEAMTGWNVMSWLLRSRHW